MYIMNVDESRMDTVMLDLSADTFFSLSTRYAAARLWVARIDLLRCRHGVVVSIVVWINVSQHQVRLVVGWVTVN